MREYHLYLGNVDKNTKDIICNSIHDIEILKKYGKSIHTEQIVSCTTQLFTDGYRIFIHPFEGDEFEITLGYCKRTEREIRMGHNLFRMLINGAFGDVTGEDVDDT